MHFLKLRGFDLPDADTLEVQFSRSLPVNRLEVAQTLQAYDGLVSKRDLLTQVPFIEDAQAAIERLLAEGTSASVHVRPVVNGSPALAAGQ